MLYLEYERYRKKYFDAQEYLNKLIDRKEMIFQKTQPQSPAFDMDRVSGGVAINKTEAYVIEIEELDISLDVAKAILDERLLLLRQKEHEIRNSKETDDVIYCLRYIECMKIKDIANRLSYSEPHIYRILRDIRMNIEHDKK